jgi:hypothetical protein
MAQEIYRPGERLPAERPISEAERLEQSIDVLSGKLNLFARWSANLKAGRNAASVVVEMQKIVAEAQREVVEHHANLIARDHKIQLTDHFQAKITEVTKRVHERSNEETKYYWAKLVDQDEYYEEFFEKNIRELEERVATGGMSRERADVRIAQLKARRDEQQSRDSSLIAELIDASERIVRQALRDFRPS